MPKALWNDQVIAEAPVHEIARVEGNVYFPPAAVKREFLRASDTHSRCRRKGIASYFDVVVDGKVNKAAAWYYPEPHDVAAHIRNHIAFWRGVTIRE